MTEFDLSNLSCDVTQIDLKKGANTKDNQRTFNVSMVITDQEAEFMTMVVSRFVGHIIGYQLLGKKNPARSFVRSVSVDTDAKTITVYPVEFKAQRTEDDPFITEKRKGVFTMNIVDLADLVTIGDSKAKVVVAD